MPLKRYSFILKLDCTRCQNLNLELLVTYLVALTNSPNCAFVTSYLSIQKLVTVTSPGDRSSTKLELSDPILNVPPEIITIPWGQGLTVAANAVVWMNKSAIAIPEMNISVRK